MKSGLISIIVPVYNVEQYIEKCIESIIIQTYENIEIILVNDGSIDKSKEICESWKEKDERVILINKKNGGVSSARNAGLELAKGEFIMFVDSDDCIKKDLCEVLISHMDDQCDLIASCITIKNKGIFGNGIKRNILIAKQWGDDFKDLFQANLLNVSYAKLYRKLTIDELRFPEGISLGEDLLFNLNFFKKSKKLLFITYSGYFYNIQNANSIMHSFHEKDYEQKKCLHKALSDFIIEMNIDRTCVKIIDNAFIDDAEGYLQHLYFSKHTRKYKKQVAKKVLSDELLRTCCSKKLLFRLRCEILLAGYFGIKYFLKKILGKF